MRTVLIGLAFALATCSAGARDEAPTSASGESAAAVFAGGCFWCTESDFDKVPGVLSTTSGYTGGRVENPTYEQVSGGNTGHIESVRVVYDPRRVGYSALVEHFFHTIDPLDGGGQFCDRGSQYRSAIFVASEQERQIAEGIKAKLAKVLRKQIATEILPAAHFYPAEDYHQDYYKKNPIRYRFYRGNCGRDGRVEKVWGESAH
jgi:peptide-methionine (S)-S-oxide reductase